MASIRREMVIDAAPEKVWDAVRDIGAIHTRLAHAQREIEHARARTRVLSPLATLDRGYAVVIGPAGVVRSTDELGIDDEVRVRVSRGDFAARVTDIASGP